MTPLENLKSIEEVEAALDFLRAQVGDLTLEAQTAEGYQSDKVTELRRLMLRLDAVLNRSVSRREPDTRLYTPFPLNPEEGQTDA